MVLNEVQKFAILTVRNEMRNIHARERSLAQ